MKHIIANLTRQHRDLTESGAALVPLLGDKLDAEQAQRAHRQLSQFLGVLGVHLAMEDDSFYPRLLQHRNTELREVARRYLDERETLQSEVERYRQRYANAAAVERAAAQFTADTQQLLMALTKRMMREERELHPEIIKRWAE